MLFRSGEGRGGEERKGGEEEERRGGEAAVSSNNIDVKYRKPAGEEERRIQRTEGKEVRMRLKAGTRTSFWVF